MMYHQAIVTLHHILLIEEVVTWVEYININQRVVYHHFG